MDPFSLFSMTLCIYSIPSYANYKQQLSNIFEEIMDESMTENRTQSLIFIKVIYVR